MYNSFCIETKHIFESFCPQSYLILKVFVQPLDGLWTTFSKIWTSDDLSNLCGAFLFFFVLYLSSSIHIDL